LAKCPPRPLHLQKKESGQGKFDFNEKSENKSKPLVDELNDLTAQVLGLDSRERALVHDLVRVRFQLNDGKRGHEAMRPPENSELRDYARRLKQELDDFVGDDSDRLHRVTVVHADDSAMVEVDFTRDHEAARKVELLRATSEEAKRLRTKRKELLEERAQWVYFNRNLRIYRGHQTYLFKPLQRFHWTESAAMMDASDLIAETLGGGQ
jgi:replication fork clamp-binding protein CrfC